MGHVPSILCRLCCEKVSCSKNVVKMFEFPLIRFFFSVRDTSLGLGSWHLDCILLQESVNDLDYKPSYNPWRNSASPSTKKMDQNRYDPLNAWTFLDRQGCCRHVKAWSDQLAASGLGVSKGFINALVEFHGMLERDIHIESQKWRDESWDIKEHLYRSICMINLLFHVQKQLFFKAFEFFQWHPTNCGCFRTINVYIISRYLIFFVV